MPTPVIDSQKCTLCGNCVKLCPMEVLKKEDKITVVKPNECIACRACEVQCEKQAIKVVD